MMKKAVNEVQQCRVHVDSVRARDSPPLAQDIGDADAKLLVAEMILRQTPPSDMSKYKNANAISSDMLFSQGNDDQARRT